MSMENGARRLTKANEYEASMIQPLVKTLIDWIDKYGKESKDGETKRWTNPSGKELFYGSVKDGMFEGGVDGEVIIYYGDGGEIVFCSKKIKKLMERTERLCGIL